MPEATKIHRALISVYDKTGIVDFARALHEEFGIELISTGGTAKTLQDAGLPVTLVEQVTGFPEMLDGRVKTLHPKIHAAILADRDNPEHMRQLREQDIEPIDMVVVNLYAFEQTIAKPDCTFDEAIEMIDIGGPCLLRAAAKNHKHVLVVPGADFYTFIMRSLRSADTPRDYMAKTAFETTQAYDAKIAHWLLARAKGELRPLRMLLMSPLRKLRYGENPLQAGTLLATVDHAGEEHPFLAESYAADVELSFNNYLDASAALELCAELTRAGSRVLHRPTAGGVWHRLPAGDSVAPASSRWRPIADEHCTRRNLPYIQVPGRTYFITFRVRQGELPDQARGMVLEACRHWHGRKMNLHIATVMPDHVHLLLTPFLHGNDSAVPLGELLHSIKSFSANQVNRLLNRSGSLWLDESFDRIMRDQAEFSQTWEYIETNAERAGLGPDYPWVWKSQAEFEEAGLLDAPDATDHRLEAGATQQAATQQAGATPNVGPRVVCFIKHTNACGTAIDVDPVAAYRNAYLGDPNAAMGGILAVNFKVDAAFAETVMDTYARFGKPLKDAGAAYAPGGFFVEVWLAPEFDEKAVEIIRTKKEWGQRVRLFAVGDLSASPDANELDFKRIAGGMLMQSRDLVGLNEDQWQVVTKRRPSEIEMNDLRLAWLICKHTKSNAITICKAGLLLGNGAGQMSRVMSCRIATWLAQENGHAADLSGAVAASDAFFPFSDGPIILMDAGVTALIQPGGSKRDADTIAAADERGVAMIFTGTRHFKH
jgi:AICAR transformylase/IMP cyclohydrolase PurH/REP element-mobilizing transposase RayT